MNFTVMYGKKKSFNKHSAFLFEDIIDYDVAQHVAGTISSEKWMLQPSLTKIQSVYKWVYQNNISEDDCMLGYYATTRLLELATCVKYYLQLEQVEHRTLFLLCKDEILNIKEIA